MSRMAGSNKAFQSELMRLYHTVALYRAAVELGWYDYYARFRRSIIGPLWSPIQMGVFVGVLALLFNRGLGDSTGNYALYLGLGYFAWDFISGCLTSGSEHFTSQGQLIKNVPVSLSQITVRKVSFLFCRAAVNSPIPIGLILFSGDTLNANAFWILLVLPIYAVMAYSCLIIFGVIGAFFRDFTFLLQTSTRFIFFTSPIIWQGDAGVRKVISTYNPISYFIEIFRAPLSGEVASLLAWSITIGASLCSLAVAIFVQSAFRNRLIYRC